MKNSPINRSVRWYQKWWGVILITVLIAFLVLVVLTSVAIGKHYWQIKHGKISYLKNSIYTDFSKSGDSISNTNSKIKREELETSDDPFLGNPIAKLVVVEFVDFKCPNCKKADQIMNQLMTKYAYKVKLIVRDFPVESTHPGADKLAQIAYCAQQQGRYWEMSKQLFNDQDLLPASLTNSDIQNLANKTKVDFAKLQECLNNKKTNIEVNKDYTDGIKFGVRGTPTFFIIGQKVEGVVPFSSWEKMIKDFE